MARSRSDDAEVGLEPAAEPDAALRLALPEHAFHERVLDEPIHQRQFGAGGENVDVAARFGASPQAADRLDLRARRLLLEVLDQQGCRIVRVGQQVAAAVLPALVDGLENERFLLRAHSLQRTHPAVLCGTLQLVQRFHAEFLVKDGDGLGPDALEVQQVEDRGRKLGEQFLVKWRVARIRDLPDACGQVLADAGNLAQLGCVQRAQIVRMVGHDVGAIAVCANLERVLALDLEQIGDLAENSRD